MPKDSLIDFRHALGSDYLMPDAVSSGGVISINRTIAPRPVESGIFRLSPQAFWTGWLPPIKDK